MYNKSVMELTPGSQSEPSKPAPAPIIDVAPPAKPAESSVASPPPEAEDGEDEHPAAPSALSRPAKVRSAHALPLGPLVLSIIIFIGLTAVAYLAYSRHG